MFLTGVKSPYVKIMMLVDTTGCCFTHPHMNSTACNNFVDDSPVIEQFLCSTGGVLGIHTGCTPLLN